MSTVVKTPGQQLREAREEVGKTLSELAKTTRIGVSQLEGLEADDYSKIPAPMYVRGFMKIYAQELGLRHEPLVEMYERLQNGETPGEKPEEPVVPAPVGEEDTAVRTHTPGWRLPAWKPLNVRTHLKSLLTKLPDPPDFASVLNPERLRSPRVRIAAVVVVLLLLFTALRSCGGDSPEPESGLPEVEEPLLNPPDPVFFELPRSFN